MPVIIMTKEENRMFIPPGQVGQEPELIRRSRSLSELPGHLRVPILKRKDTERTQARLKAGDAGVQELRDLRQQHEQRMNETMAAVQHKRKKKKDQANDTLNQDSPHRLQKQQEFDPTLHQTRVRPLSASHSSSSLARISEERENSLKLRPKPEDFHRHSHKSTSRQNHQPQHHDPRHQNCHSYHQEHQRHQHRHSQKSAWPGQQQHETANRDRSEQHGSHHQRGARRGENISHAPQQSNAQCHSQILTTASCQTGRTRSYSSPHDHSRYKENASLSHGAEYIPNKSHKPRVPTAVADHRRQTVQEESHERFDRGRSQSVHENFNYFPNKRGSNLADSNLQYQRKFHRVEVRNQGEYAHQSKQPEGQSSFNHSRSETNFSKTDSPHRLTEDGPRRAESHSAGEKSIHMSPTDTVSPHHSMSESHTQRSACNKSISWDNLLISIGINSTGSVASLDTSNEVPEQEDEIFYSNLPAGTKVVDRPDEQIRQNDEIVTQRVGRSKSFTSALTTSGPTSTYDKPLSHKRTESLNLDSALNKTRNVSPDCTKQNFSPMLRHGSADPRSFTGQKSTAILRRASIQCEAVLTKSTTDNRIVNPLQDVDINSLHTPGPLHAVTMQFSSLPRKKTSEKIAASNSSPSVSEGKSTQEKMSPAKAEVLHARISKPTNESLHPIFEDSKQANNQSQAVSKYQDRSMLSDDSRQAPQHSGRIEQARAERVSPQLKIKPVSNANAQPGLREVRNSARRALFPNSACALDQVDSRTDTLNTNRSSDTSSSPKMFSFSGKGENLSRHGSHATSFPMDYAEGNQNSRPTQIDSLELSANPGSLKNTESGSHFPYKEMSFKARGEQDSQNPTSTTNAKQNCVDLSQSVVSNEKTGRSCAEGSVEEGSFGKGAVGVISTYSTNEFQESCDRQKKQQSNDNKTKSDSQYAKNTKEDAMAGPLKEFKDQYDSRLATRLADIKNSEERESYISEKTINLKANSKSKEAVAESTDTSETRKATSKSDEQVSMLPLPIDSRPFHTPDISILSDEGYSTCDSTSPKWRMSSHGYQSSEISSMSSGSVTSMNLFGDAFLQSQHHSPAMRYLIQERMKKCNSLGPHNSVPEVEDDGARENTFTNVTIQHRFDDVANTTCTGLDSGAKLSSKAKKKVCVPVSEVRQAAFSKVQLQPSDPKSRQSISASLIRCDETKDDNIATDLLREGLVQTEDSNNKHDKACTSNKAHQRASVKEGRDSEMCPDQNVAIVEKGPVLSLSVNTGIEEKKNSENESDSPKLEGYPNSDNNLQPFRQTAV